MYMHATTCEASCDQTHTQKHFVVQCRQEAGIRGTSGGADRQLIVSEVSFPFSVSVDRPGKPARCAHGPARCGYAAVAVPSAGGAPWCPGRSVARSATR